MITIPNATFVNLDIINLTNRDRMPYKRTVALRATDGLGIRQELEALTQLVAGHPMIEPGSLEVRLREDQEEKPKAEIRALIMTSKWEEFLRIQQDIDLMLRDAVIVRRNDLRRDLRKPMLERNDNAPSETNLP